MNIPQMLSHRGSETHTYVVNNAKDLRLKMTTGHSREPRDGGSGGGWSCCGGQQERGWRGGLTPCPGSVHGAAWGGWIPLGVPAPHGAALAV